MNQKQLPKITSKKKFLANYYLLLTGLMIAQALFVVLTNNSDINQNQNLTDLEKQQTKLGKEIRDLENQIADNQSLIRHKSQPENNEFVEITDREVISASDLPVLMAQK